MHYSGHWAQRCDVEYDGVSPTFWDALTLYGQRCKCSFWHILCAQSSKLFTTSNFCGLRAVVAAIAWSLKLFGGQRRIVKFTTSFWHWRRMGRAKYYVCIMESLSRHVTHKRSDHLGTVCSHTHTHERMKLEHTRQFKQNAQKDRQTESEINKYS